MNGILVLFMTWITIPCLQASVAKLETSVSFFSDKLELKVYGFNDKLPVLLSKVLAIAKSFLPTDDRFKVCSNLLLHFLSALSLVLVKFFLESGLVVFCPICDHLTVTLSGYQRTYEENF